MEAARRQNDKVVVSIFVNPIQFGPGEDLDAYPRDFGRDQALCGQAGVDLIFHPEAAELYAPDFCTYVDMDGLTAEPVSYTHLDVYKRQRRRWPQAAPVAEPLAAYGFPACCAIVPLRLPNQKARRRR